MAISLTQFIQALADEGVVGEEAEEAVEKFMAMRKAGKRSKGGALAKRASTEIEFPSSPQEDRGVQRVDYGDETPQEAEERWIRQEMEDPDGVFAGGSTAGGIFGDAPIATRSFDPAARRRTMDIEESKSNIIERRVTIAVLSKIAGRLGCDLSDLEDILPGRPDPKQLSGRRRR